ncbi:hypothetical protein BH18CHL1_BH18CHL1_10290 [soil metagenome]
MLLLYAIPLGLLAGLLAGGRIAPLANVRFQWGPVALAGLLFQLALFSEPLASQVGHAGPGLYVASTAVVLLVILRNISAAGMSVISAGALFNLAAIVANGGQMPADPAAVVALTGRPVIGVDSFTNSALAGAGTALPFLGDTMVFPRPLPLANVFSIGDLLIGLGAVLFLVRTMRQTTPATSTTSRRSVTWRVPRVLADGG